MIKVEQKFDLRRISFDFHKELNLIADMIVKDHLKRLDGGQGVDGRPLKKLAPSTIHSKRHKGSSTPRKPLVNTGVMKKVYVSKRATKSNLEAIIIPPKKRAKVAAIHQEGTSPYTIKVKNAKVLGPLFDSRGNMYFSKEVHHPGHPKREWFGVTKKIMNEADRFISLELEREIKRA